MIRMLRKKFTVTAMIAVTVLLLVILGAINGVNAWTNHREIKDQMDMICEMLSGREEMPDHRQFFHDRERLGGLGPMPVGEALLSAQYYVVYPDGSGALTQVDSHIPYGSAAEALALLQEIGTRNEGSTGSFRFRVLQGEDGSAEAVVFLYTGLQYHNVLRLALLSLLGFALGWGLMLLLVMFLSKKAIEPIAESMEKQKRFVTDAGHELKTPLAIILANTEAMELRQGENKYTRNIRDQVQRLSGLTQNLLTLARADESQTVMNAADFSLSELTEESVRPFMEPAELKSIALSADIAEHIHVRANRQQLGQLLSILLDNAVKYTPEGGSIQVNLKKEGKAVLQVKNTVTDTSVPTERLFDRFYRADSARTQKNGGYGIGLSAARAIAEAHRGSLTAGYDGNNIVFTLKL